MVFCQCLKPTTELYLLHVICVGVTGSKQARHKLIDPPTISNHMFASWLAGKEEEMMQAEARLSCQIRWCGLGATLNSTKEWKQTLPHWRVSRTCDALCGTRKYLDEKMRPSMMSGYVESCWNCMELLHVESQWARWAERVQDLYTLWGSFGVIRRYKNST